MGLEDHEVDLATWRLVVDGAVGKKLELTYADLLSFPPVEKQGSLDMPRHLCKQWTVEGRVREDPTGTSRGYSGGQLRHIPRSKGQTTRKHTGCRCHKWMTPRYCSRTRVNGKKLPRKHGFPLRLVASDYRGDDWIKYVHRVTADRNLSFCTDSTTLYRAGTVVAILEPGAEYRGRALTSTLSQGEKEKSPHLRGRRRRALSQGEKEKSPLQENRYRAASPEEPPLTRGESGKGASHVTHVLKQTAIGITAMAKSATRAFD